ncbi:MAG: DUF4199 domain-containing protein [Ekhidna sp.]
MEESSNTTVKSVAMKWGVINGLLAIVLLLIIDFAGLIGNQAVGWIGYVVFLVLLILAHKQFKEEGDGYMSYGQGLGIGTLAMVISSVISSTFFFIYISFINSEFVDFIKEKSIMDMENQGMSDAEIEQAMGFSESFMSPVALTIFGLLGAIFFGFIISLIVSAITKNTQPEEI